MTERQNLYRQKDRQADRYIDNICNKQIDRQRDRQIDRQIERQIDIYRQIGRQIDSQIDRQIDGLEKNSQSGSFTLNTQAVTLVQFYRKVGERLFIHDMIHQQFNIQNI